MNICHDGHKEIVHQEFACPVCAILAEMKEKDKRIDWLEIREEEHAAETEAREVAAALAATKERTDDAG